MRLMLNIDKARKKLDCTEPANSYHAIFYIQREKAKCRFCETRISCNNYRTAVMEKHLRSKHKTFHAEFAGAKAKTEKRRATPESVL